MKKILLLLFSLLLLSSCNTMLFTGRPKDSVVITNYSQKMNALKKYFPELYELFKNGIITVDEIYLYDFKEGDPKAKVKYTYL